MVSDIKGYNTRETSASRQGQASGVRADRQVEAGSASGTQPAKDDTVALSGLSEVIKTAAAKLAADNPCMKCGLFYEIRTLEGERCSAENTTTESPHR